MKRSDLFPKQASLWTQYCRDYVELEGKTVYFNRFIARYSLAKGFKGIDAHTFRRSTLMGYDAVMRLMLVFSAYDNLFKAIEKLTPQLCLTYDMHSFQIRESELEVNFRSNHLLMRLLMADARDASLTRLEEFKRGGNSITCIAFGIRNMVAHGQMNPTASKANTNNVALQINKLAQLVLDACDFIFEDYLKVLKEVLDDNVKADISLIAKESKQIQLEQKNKVKKNVSDVKKIYWNNHNKLNVGVS
jgi:hypothetical protein